MITEMSYLWQIDVWNDDTVESAWSILGRVSWVTAWVVFCVEGLLVMSRPLENNIRCRKSPQPAVG